MILKCTTDILKGVEYLHSIRVVHRDLKPANILVFKDLTVKIGDFGLAREFVNDKMIVRDEVSTLWYRAPELIMGAESYSSKIDEWSVGVIALEMLNGQCPLMGKVDYGCKCSEPSHFNYNSDQLKRIFHLLGSPRNPKYLLGLNCLRHFKDWPKQTRTLDEVVTSLCLKRRFQSSKGIEVQEEQLERVRGQLRRFVALKAAVGQTNLCRNSQRAPHARPSRQNAGTSRTFLLTSFSLPDSLHRF